ncbi:hypothetical protein NPIL_619301 [Nephila pilipes]|uniref:Uncharacterized protein n=1 Tax=Nephila pilipes TaxID=299642 RepID=A0A8X6JQY1_NEPPI|nr:hypothetical protein NPIL_619301 [Nephila pilipes]
MLKIGINVAHEFEVFLESSVPVCSDFMKPGTYELLEGNVSICATPDSYYDFNSTDDYDTLKHTKDDSTVTIMSKVGSAISEITLTGH